MQNTTLNQNYQNNEFNFREIINILLDSRTLIIVLTLIITIFVGVYSFFQQTKHVIQATVEIGQYDQELILSSDEIEFDINVLFNHSISQIGGKFLILKHTSDDKEESTRKINEIIDYESSINSILFNRVAFLFWGSQLAANLIPPVFPILVILKVENEFIGTNNI